MKIKARAHKKKQRAQKGNNQSDRLKLKRRIEMERCLLVGRVGEDGSSIRQKRQKDTKKKTTQSTHSYRLKLKKKKW